MFTVSWKTDGFRLWAKVVLCAPPPYRETEVEEWVKKYDDEMTAKDSEFHSETELYTQGASTLRITAPPTRIIIHPCRPA